MEMVGARYGAQPTSLPPIGSAPPMDIKPTRSAALAALVLIVALFGMYVYSISNESIQQDAVGVVVGGGPLDGQKNKIKGEIHEPGRIIHGTFDRVRQFPSNRAIRFQNFDVKVTTKDGKNVQLIGQLGFRFVGETNPALTLDFARGVGARQYSVTTSSGDVTRERPGEDGPSGPAWTAFLDTMATPEIYAAVKVRIGTEYCANFEPSCRVIDPRDSLPETDPDAVYSTLAQDIDKRMAIKLGSVAKPKRYLTDFRFTVNQVVLDEQVQQNIAALAAEQAATKSAQQAEKTATARAAAIRTIGNALRKNPSQVGVEIVKACGSKCTVIVDGTGKGATVAQTTK